MDETRIEENEETMTELEAESVFPSEEELAYPEVTTLIAEGETEEGDEFSLELEYYDEDLQEEKLWMARTGLNRDTLCGAIETIIFMSDRPVPLIKIKKMIDEDMPLRVIHESIERLQEDYELRHHGIRMVEVAEGYQFRTKSTYSKYVQDLFRVNSLVLSPTALEVLAIIAYKQPVAKTEVDKIRGVDSSHIVRGLMDKRLVKVAGRSNEAGRPTLYGTTPEFLEVFNLADLGQLPPEHELEDMSSQGVGKIADVKSLVHSGDKAAFVFDEIDELDELSEEIKNISAETEFTRSLKIEDKKRMETEEGSRPKTAFDILEEYVNRELMHNLNKESFASEPFTNIIDASVISDLTAGPFNLPEEEDEEDFQMIDLDTGLPIEEDELEIKGSDLLSENEEEAAELAQALDDAFAKLTGESLDDLYEEREISDSELDLNQSRIDESEKSLEDKTLKIMEDGKDLDLDLSFLGDQDENTSDSEPQSEDY